MGLYGLGDERSLIISLPASLGRGVIVEVHHCMINSLARVWYVFKPVAEEVVNMRGGWADPDLFL